MPSIIDSLVLELGLDGSKFTEGRRRLEDEFTRTRREVESFGRGVEEQGQKISDAFVFMKRGVTGLLGAFIGDQAATFIDRIATMDAHTGRLARSIGQSTHELSMWQNMVRLVGGSAEDASQTLTSLRDTFNDMAMGNQMPSPGFASLMTRAGVNFRNSSPGQGLGQIMQFLSTVPEDQRRFWLRQVPGMNESMMFLMLEGAANPRRIQEMREQLEKLGVASQLSAEQGAELVKNTGLLQTALEQLARVGFPVLTSIVESITAMFERFQGPEGWKGGVRSFLNPNKGTPQEGTIDRWSEAMFNMMFGNPAPKSDVEAKIRQSFAAQGIDPDVAVRVARGESGLNTTALGDKVAGIPTSFGVFQLHRGGLAEEFQKSTGHQPTDPQFWGDQVDFVAKWVKDHGWSDFHAHKGDPWEGVRRGKQSSVTINNQISVVSSKADPKAVADQIPEAMRRYSMLGAVDVGLT